MQSLALSRSALSNFQQAGFSVALFSRRHMSMERIARELRTKDDSRGRSSAPNLAAFTVAAAAAGMVTALLFETKEQEQSWLGRGNEGPRSPYPEPRALTAPTTYSPNPLRVRLEFVMAEQQRIGGEVEALTKRRWSRETGRRRKELARALKDLEAEQGILVEEAKRQLLRQA